ncbi:MAG: DUF3365 domain-containing protein [Proteobacteria bacterium]|nr:DUF3365 domain-containing protein [Pseudomonadota bacterium]MBU1737921.1 DUF3365 domain-containing protein [Pseudomonadota bacterium]
MIDHQKKNKRRPGLGIYLNFGLAVVFAGAATYLVNVIHTQEQQQALFEAETKAKILLDRNLATHAYFSHTLKPKVFALTEPVRSDSYFDPSWMSSTHAVREIDKHFKALNDEGYYYKECAINARSPENEADAFEKAFIEELNGDPELKYRSLIRNLDGAFYYVTLRRGEVMEESCLRCHSTPDKAPKHLVGLYGPERSFNRRANEVVSAISIRVPLSDAYAKADRFSRYLSKIFISTLLLLFAVQYVVYRFVILGPITRLKNKALEISENDGLLGEEIPLPITREFGEMASAFNTMSHKLRNQFDHLEEKVEERTRELKAANRELQKALDEIKTLKGIVPICMHCKEIRDDKGYWNQLEKFISDHSEAQFSHSICDKCLEKHYPEYKEE